MKLIRITWMLTLLFGWANARADITLNDSSGDAEVRVTFATEKQTNVFNATDFNVMLTTNEMSGDMTNTTVETDQNTTSGISGETLSFVSTGNSDISVTPSDITTAFGNATTAFDASFSVTQASTFVLGGSVTVDTGGDFGSSEAQVTFSGSSSDTNIFLDFDSSDDPGAPRQVTISGTGTIDAGNFSIFVFAISTLSESQVMSHAHWDLTVSVTPLPPPPPPTEVDLVGLEVVQSIQDWHNSIPLVKGKRTFVRAHYQSAGASQEAVTGKLHGFINGLEFPESPLSPINTFGFIITTQNAAAERKDFNSSLNFQLPQSWVDGTVQLRLDSTNVVPPTLKFVCAEPAEQGGSASNCELQVTFSPEPRPQIKFFKIQQTLPSGQTVNAVLDRDVFEVEKRTQAMYPVDFLDFTIDQISFATNIVGNFAAMNAQLSFHRALDGCDGDPACRRIYYGILRGIPPGLIDGQAAAVPSDIATGFLHDGFGFNRAVAPHELAHTLGRPHAVSQAQFGFGTCPFVGGSGVLGPCFECAASGTPDFPFYFNVNGKMRPTLGPMNSGQDNVIFGYDTYANRVVDPNKNFELMGYCGPDFTWASTFTYTNLLSAISSRFTGASALAVIQAAGTTNLLIVRGTINVFNDATTLLPFGHVNSMSPPLPAPGDYTLRLLDGVGNVLTEIPFQPDFIDEFDEMLSTFQIIVPDDSTIREVVVLHNGNAIASRLASSNAPTVEVLSPNGGENLTNDPVVLNWQANDADGDTLTYVVQYSANGGATFDTLAVDWPDTTLAIPHAILAGSTNGVFRVMANDGFNTATDDSDATFNVANNPPVVFIFAPSEAQIFFASQPVFLEASALDREDGILSDANLQWTSDLDGALGTGTELNLIADQLSDGTHLITVIATDSASVTSSASVHIVVERATPTTLANLSVTKEAATDFVAAGTDLSYTLTVENQGPNTATGVTLIDTLPAGANLVSVTTSQGNCSPSVNIINCNLGSLTSGSNITATVVLRPMVEGIITNTVIVAGSDTDPVPANNMAQAIVVVGAPPPTPHDLTLVKMKAPKTITLKGAGASVTKSVKVTLQNRSPHNETITNFNSLVTLVAESLGTNCPNATVVLHPGPPNNPKTLKPKQKMTVTFDVTWNCANDPLKGEGHEDFRYLALVHHEAIDGNPDTHPEDDGCPRAALPGGVDPNPDPNKPLKDTGCAGGVDVKTDVFLKQ